MTHRARRVETVLENVEVEAAEVGRGVGLQERHGRCGSGTSLYSGP